MSCPADVQVNARQEKAPRYLARHGKITRREYRNLFCVSARQSLRDLTELAEKGTSIHSGKGRATSYLFPTARLVRNYCAVRKTGDSPSRTAQSGGEPEEGRRSAPLGRVRGEG